jgi:glucose/mannose-6-phosphate isomerase
MIDDVLGIPDQLRDALWRIESARLQPSEADGVLLCGMGGSAIGGNLANAALGDRRTKPFMVIRGYGLPSWATPDWLVMCSSYSGQTEETLACFDAAGALGARRIVISTGGTLVDQAREAGVPVVAPPGIFQPRAAIAYMFTAAVEIAALCGAAPRIHTEIDAAAAFLEAESEALQERASEIATRLDGGVPVIYGVDLTGPVARRWKTQINENAKLPCFYSELPEADHNEICGWNQRAADAELAAVFLEDCDQHPRERRRIELTAQAVDEAGATALRIETAGGTRVARLLWATMLGDLVSLELAKLRGVDPVPVESIERFKEAMGRP